MVLISTSNKSTFRNVKLHWVTTPCAHAEAAWRSLKHTHSPCYSLEIWQKCPKLLTTRGDGVFEHLIELCEVHHHGQLIWLSNGCHFLSSHNGRYSKLFLSNVKGQLVILLHIVLIQGIKVSAKGKKRPCTESSRNQSSERTQTSIFFFFLL